MQENNKASGEVEIDLGALLLEIVKGLPIILLCVVIGVLSAFILYHVRTEPRFVSTTKLYVLPSANSEYVSSQQLSAGTQLTMDYQDIVTSRPVTEAVIASLKLMRNNNVMTHQQLASMISVSSTDSTRILEIRITDTDPYRACDIANAVRDKTAERISVVMDADTVKPIDTANIPLTRSGASMRRTLMIGALLGLLAAVIGIVVSYLTNDTIRSSEDVEKYLGLSTLGMIPMAEGEAKSSKKARKRAGMFTGRRSAGRRQS